MISNSMKGNKNILKLIVIMVAQCGEYTQNGHSEIADFVHFHNYAL